MSAVGLMGKAVKSAAKSRRASDAAIGATNYGLMDLNDPYNLKNSASLLNPRAAGIAAGALAAGAADDAEALNLKILSKSGDWIGEFANYMNRQQQLGVKPESAMKKFMHDNQHSTYNDWVREARTKDGGRGGEVYKQGLKDMLVPMSKDERVYKSKYMQQALRDWGLSRLARPATFATGMGVGTAAMAAEDAREDLDFELLESVQPDPKPRGLWDTIKDFSWLGNDAVRAVAGGLLANELKRSDAPGAAILGVGEGIYQATNGGSFTDAVQTAVDDGQIATLDKWGQRSPLLGATASVGSVLLPH